MKSFVNLKRDYAKLQNQVQRSTNRKGKKHHEHNSR